LSERRVKKEPAGRATNVGQQFPVRNETATRLALSFVLVLFEVSMQGRRCAVVADSDGYRSDLFAPL